MSQELAELYASHMTSLACQARGAIRDLDPKVGIYNILIQKISLIFFIFFICFVLFYFILYYIFYLNFILLYFISFVLVYFVLVSFLKSLLIIIACYDGYFILLYCNKVIGNINRKWYFEFLFNQLFKFVLKISLLYDIKYHILIRLIKLFDLYQTLN